MKKWRAQQTTGRSAYLIIILFYSMLPTEHYDNRLYAGVNSTVAVIFNGWVTNNCYNSRIGQKPPCERTILVVLDLSKHTVNHTTLLEVIEQTTLTPRLRDGP